MQQTFLPKTKLKYLKARTHGGEAMKNRRKDKRPLIPGAATHLCLKASKAKGQLSFYNHKKVVHALMKNKARKFFVEILDFVNMGNHLHIKVRFKDPKRFQQFLKSYTSLLARMITGARRGQPFGKFWDGLAYTRVLTSAFEELSLRGYFEANHRERELGWQERKFYLYNWNEFLGRLKARGPSRQTIS